jgi:hypothetical protein
MAGHRSSPPNQQYRVIHRSDRDQVFVDVVDVTAHDYRRSEMKDDRKAAKRIDVSIGDSVRILREFQELSQNELAALTGIPSRRSRQSNGIA